MNIYLILATFFVSCECKILLQTVEGEVPPENFTYWSLNYIGDLLLVLNSTYGDVDMYVSETLSKPGYEPELYDLHSATCGVDVIEIPKSFRRPVGVALYGYYLYNRSHFNLAIYLDTEKESTREWEYPELETTTASVSSDTTETKQSKPKTENSKMKSKLKTVMARSGFWAFLELFEMLFL